MSNEKVLFRKGTTPMDSDFIEYSFNDGHIVERRYGMGGQSKRVVSKIPSHISGYSKIRGDL